MELYAIQLYIYKQYVPMELNSLAKDPSTTLGEDNTNEHIGH
jgi:hypothetical protein